jgi:hypothetical protein
MNVRRIFVPITATYVVAMAFMGCRSDGGTFGTGGQPFLDTGYPHGNGDSDTGAAVDTSDSSVDSSDSDTFSDTGATYTGTGFEVGDVAYDLLASDQNGDSWSLYAHSAEPVVIVFGYAQDYNFQAICGFLPAVEAKYAAEAVSVVVFLSLDPLGVRSNASDAASWSSTYGLSTVLWDSEGTVTGIWAAATQVKTYLIAGNMQINWVHTDYTGQEQLSDKIHDLLFP